MGYTKLFSSIIASTIWREDDKTRIVWITMLALKNERHIVEASLPGLADLARVSFKECEAAIKKLESSDKHSRNQEHQGRRIERCQGGWRILNGEYYRRQLSDEDRKAYRRTWMANDRARKKKSPKPLPGEALNKRALERGDDQNHLDRTSDPDYLKEEHLPYRANGPIFPVQSRPPCS